MRKILLAICLVFLVASSAFAGQRYYELTPQGKVIGIYAVSQPGKVLHLLNEHATDMSYMRDGVPGENWVPDTAAIAVIDAEAARKVAKAQALIDNLPSWAQVDNAIDNISSLAEAKAFIRKLARVTYWLAKDKED